MKFTPYPYALALATLGTLASVPALAVDNTLSLDGVTFDFTLVDADTFNLTMLAANAATGGWAGVAALTHFEIKGVGSGFTGATATGPGAFAYSRKQMNANGCTGGGNSHNLCFSGYAPVAAGLSWDIDVVGAGLDVSSLGPHLQVRFVDAGGKKQGSLLSMDIPAVPEPETYALMLAGLAAVGFVARRRKSA